MTPRKKKAQEEVTESPVAEKELKRPDMMDEEEVENHFSMYDPSIHGELSDGDIEAIAIKLAGLFTAYDIFEVTVTGIELSPKLKLLLDFMDLSVTSTTSTTFDVAKKDYVQMLQAFSQFKTKEKMGDL